jgi:hypothetical protein
MRCQVAVVQEVKIVLRNFINHAKIVTADAQVGPSWTFRDIVSMAYNSWMEEALGGGEKGKKRKPPWISAHRRPDVAARDIPKVVSAVPLEGD